MLSEKHSGRGIALGDLFNNGREEAVVNNMDETPSLHYNTAPVGDFISLQFVGVKSNPRRAGGGGNALTGHGQAGTGSSQRRRLYFPERSTIAFRAWARHRGRRNFDPLAERFIGNAERSAGQSILRRARGRRDEREANSSTEHRHHQQRRRRRALKLSGCVANRNQDDRKDQTATPAQQYATARRLACFHSPVDCPRKFRRSYRAS